MNNTQLDSYSLLIVSKYLTSIKDFINVICVNSKFKETTEKLRFNPIPIKSKKLFPKIQTQYLYNKNNKKIEGIDNYEILYEVNYDQYLKYNQDNIKCHKVIYSHANRVLYGDKIPDRINELGVFCFGKENYYTNDESNIKEINIQSSLTSLCFKCFCNCSALEFVSLPSTITQLNVDCFNFCVSLSSIILSSSLVTISYGCFSNCSSLDSIDLPHTVQLLGDNCFMNCISLTSINMSSSLMTLGYGCFDNCKLLTSLDLPSTLTSLGYYCFSNCSSLISITLPSTLTSLGIGCFNNCASLTMINLPIQLEKISSQCFSNCSSLTSIILPTSLKILGDRCFINCFNLNSINEILDLKIGKNCFEECNKLKHKPHDSNCIFS